LCCLLCRKGKANPRPVAQRVGVRPKGHEPRTGNLGAVAHDVSPKKSVAPEGWTHLQGAFKGQWTLQIPVWASLAGERVNREEIAREFAHHKPVRGRPS